MSFIQYADYNPNYHANFFRERKEDLLFLKEYNSVQDNEKKMNAILNKAQEGLSQITNNYVTEEALANAIENSMSSLSSMSGDIEQIAQSMNSYFGVEKKNATKSMKELQKEYDEGFGNFELLVKDVIQKGGIVTSRKKVEKDLQRLNPANLQKEFKEVGNPLGKIGEMVGLVQLYNIGTELVNNCFKGFKNINIEVVNVGEKSGKKADGSTAATLTTDNLLIIKQGDNILYSLNLSNKLNTEYKTESKTTKRSIKLRTTTVNAFLGEHRDWSSAVYNAISYHYDTTNKKRVDYLEHSGGIARQTLGIQILYDHIFGTRASFSVGDSIFKDEVALIAYGTKIVASSSVLKTALFTKAMKDKRRYVMAQIPNRKDWINGSVESGKSNIINELDAEKKINTFNLIYNQTLQVDGPFNLTK